MSGQSAAPRLLVRIKVDLHTHTSDDPVDVIAYDALALIDRAVALGYQALAITLHDRHTDAPALRDYAAARGLVLLSGIERTIDRKHVLLINFTRRAQSVASFPDLEALKRDEPGLVIAPHPFYPHPSSLGALLTRQAHVIDAVEVHSIYARGVERFNRAAMRWAARHHKPLVGNGDIHRLSQLGTTYSIVDADPTPASICDAIRAGRVEVHTAPIGWIRMTTLMADIVTAEPRAWLQGRRR